METPVILAERGAAVLLETTPGQGRIFDRRQQRLFPSQSVESALARGWWRESYVDPNLITHELGQATVIPVPDDAHLA